MSVFCNVRLSSKNLVVPGMRSIVEYPLDLVGINGALREIRTAAPRRGGETPYEE